MFDAIKNWFSPAQEPCAENKWDANTLAMHQPGSPAAPEMNQTVTQQPVRHKFCFYLRNWLIHDSRAPLARWMCTCAVVVRRRTCAVE